ncbi:excalibur calcium-binding domain-containing protein [Leifsonia sp. RAF41]|uniref:excalibur calcium-binding domain-containing protein n=1 Tax=Leifsonia sp. RAF41 TaxID=3233056 RepID=UPI003F9E6944
MRFRSLILAALVTVAIATAVVAAPTAESASATQLTVSAGQTASTGTVVVPRVVGTSGSAATKALKTVGLKWKWSKWVIVKSNWTVTASSPKAGTHVKKGTTVKLTVKKGVAPQPAPSAVPTSEPAPAGQAPAPVAPVPVAPAPAPVAPAPAPAPAPDVAYANCAAVRAAGKAPIHAGQPGYSSKLDRDGDGVACE